MSESSAAPVNAGDVLAGKYRVERVLGRGGMGVVVAATNTLIDQRVALKFLLAEAVTGVDTVQRFIREAKAAARIQSEHVVRVLDVGTLENGLPYMVMEYLEGHDLAELVATRRSLPLDEAVGYVLQACEALAEAHAAGIVHRDIKPSNIFLAKRATGIPTVKLLDFGISKVAPNSEKSRAEAALTRTNAVMGSPLYMSPEQMTSVKTVDARADIWSLGATLYELLAGRPPFLADTLPELIASVLQTTPAPIRELRPDLPASFELVLARCLEKDRARRCVSVADLASELAPFGPKYAQLSLERISNVLETKGRTSPKAGSVPPPAEPSIAKDAAGVGTVSGATWGDEIAGVPPRSVPRAAYVVGAVVLASALFVGGRTFLTRHAESSTTPTNVTQPTATEVATTPAAPVITAEPTAEPTGSSDRAAVVAPVIRSKPQTSTSKPQPSAKASSAATTAAAAPAVATPTTPTTTAAPDLPRMGVK